jgi:hypothetical protein
VEGSCEYTKLPGQPTKDDPEAWGLGDGLTTPHLKKQLVNKGYTEKEEENKLRNITFSKQVICHPDVQNSHMLSFIDHSIIKSVCGEGHCVA